MIFESAGAASQSSRSVRHIATSRDGTWFATAEFERTVCVWDMATGRKRGPFETHLDYGGSRLAISDDGQFFAAGAYRMYGLSAYRTTDGSLLWKRKDLTKVQCVGFDPANGVLMVGFSERPLHLLDSQTGATIQTLRGVREAYVSPYEDACLFERSKHIVIRGGDRKPVRLTKKTFAVLDATFGPGRAWVTYSAGPVVCLDTTDGMTMWEHWPQHDSHFLRIAFNELTGTLFGVLWPYARGGVYSLVELDPQSGAQTSTTVLDGRPGVHEFACRGSRLITCEGYIYNLARDHKISAKRIQFDAQD